jgi:HK97 gp10 family phage protein
MTARVHIDRVKIASIQHESRPQAYLLGRAERIKAIAQILCPVDTGRLRASIKVTQLGDGGYRIGTDVSYAIYVEFGTRYMHAQPFLRPALQ